jgi:hypothetical protein
MKHFIYWKATKVWDWASNYRLESIMWLMDIIRDWSYQY